MKNFFTMMVATLLLVGTVVNAQEALWNGSVDSDWLNPANWTVNHSFISTAADGITTTEINVTTWDPNNGEYWYTDADGNDAKFNWDIRIPAGVSCVMGVGVNGFNNLKAPSWTRANNFYTEVGSSLEIGGEMYVNDYVSFAGDVTFVSGGLMNARGGYLSIGKDGDGTVVVNEGAEFTSKTRMQLGVYEEEKDPVTGEPNGVVLRNFVGNMIINGGTVYNTGAAGFEIDANTTSSVILNSGVLNAKIRHLNETGFMRDGLVVVNGGTFNCYHDELSIQFAIAGNQIKSGNSGTLVVSAEMSDQWGNTYFAITNDNPTATPEVSELELSIYPNPVNGGSFNIDVPFTGSDVVVTIYNTVGQVVYTQNHGAVESIVVDSSLNKGLYLVEVTSGLQKSNQKLIIN